MMNFVEDEMNPDVKKKLEEVVNTLNQITSVMEVAGNRWKDGSRKNEFFLRLTNYIFIVGLDDSEQNNPALYVQITTIQGEDVFFVKIPRTDAENYDSVLGLYNNIMEMRNRKDVKSLSEIFEELEKTRNKLEQNQKELKSKLEK